MVYVCLMHIPDTLMIYIYAWGSLSVTEEKEKEEKDFYSSSIRLGYGIYYD